MGEIKKVLATKKLEPRTITPTGIWADLCENIHLHVRNLRFDMSQEEWSRYRAAMSHLGQAIEYLADKHNYEEGDVNFCVLAQYNFPYLSSNSDYFANRAAIELQRGENVHIHWRDLRLDITKNEFMDIALMFTEAMEAFLELEAGKHDLPDWVRDAKEIVQGWIPIQCVQPYDEGHRAGAEDKEHRAGIEYCKRLIEAGKQLRPIYIASNGQRLDGYKRYMAALELGHTGIEAIVDPFWVVENVALSGQQAGQSLLADEEGTENNS